MPLSTGGWHKRASSDSTSSTRTPTGNSLLPFSFFLFSFLLYCERMTGPRPITAFQTTRPPGCPLKSRSYLFPTASEYQPYKNVAKAWDLKGDLRFVQTKKGNRSHALTYFQSHSCSCLRCLNTPTHTTHAGASVWLISLKIASSSRACCFSRTETDSWIDLDSVPPNKISSKAPAHIATALSTTARREKLQHMHSERMPKCIGIILLYIWVIVLISKILQIRQGFKTQEALWSTICPL